MYSKQMAVNADEGNLLLHDSALPLTACDTQELLQSFRWIVLAHTFHNPDLISKFHFFLELKKSGWKGLSTTTRFK